MRAVQAYINISNYKYCAYKKEREIDILVWKLSIIRNKKLGFTTVLYTSTKDEEFIKKYKLDKLYDEVNYIEVSNTKLVKIDLKTFGAAFKFIAIEEEIKHPTPFFIMDTDLVFMDNTIQDYIYEPVLFWADLEPANNYPNLAHLPVPPGFKYPRYIDVKTRAFNTAIIKVSNINILKDWLELAGKFMINNPLPNVGTSFGLIITAEQRFLANVVKNKYQEPIKFFCSGNIENFGPEHFHVGGAKPYITAFKVLERSWIKALLLLIKEQDINVYNDIVENPTETINEIIYTGEKIPDNAYLYRYVKEKKEN